MAWEKSDKPKVVKVQFCLDVEEAHYLQAAADRSGMIVADFARNAVALASALTLAVPITFAPSPPVSDDAGKDLVIAGRS